MNLDLRQQRIFDRVELVAGVGTPGTGEMCVMSFVACLAGEPHTDQPICASPLIRALAIPLNDQMPRLVRQQLKAFVPRIIATNDGLDHARVLVLGRFLSDELLPGIAQRARHREAMDDRWLFTRLWSRLRQPRLDSRIAALAAEAIEETGERTGLGIQLAGSAGRLIGTCALEAEQPDEAAAYWSRGLDLLDQLCDVGLPERRVPPICEDRLAWLEACLEQHEHAAARDGQRSATSFLRAMFASPAGDSGSA